MTSSSGNDFINYISKSLCFKCSSSSDEALKAQQQIYLGDHLTRSWTRDERSAARDSPNSPELPNPEHRSQSHQSVCHTKSQQGAITRTRSSVRDSRGNRKNWASKTALQSVTTEEMQEWKQSFDNLLRSPIGCKLFRFFLMNEIAEENLLFWEAVEDLKKMKAEKRMQKLSRSIFEDFISVYSPREINIGYKMREDIVAQLSLSDYMDPAVYQDAQNQVYSLMYRDSYPRFLASAQAAKEKQEELRRKIKAKSPVRTKSRVLCCYGSDPEERDSMREENNVEMKVQEQIEEAEFTKRLSHDIAVHPPGVVSTPDKAREEPIGNNEAAKQHCDDTDDIIDPTKFSPSSQNTPVAVDVEVMKDPDSIGVNESPDGGDT